jgi:hypothetical protein
MARLPLSRRLEQAAAEAADRQRYLPQWAASPVDTHRVVIVPAHKSL